jgi:hypothetical protein
MSDSVVQMAKEFRENPDIIERSSESPADLNVLEPNDYRTRIHELRPELYALLAVVSERIVDDAVDGRNEHPPYGLRSEDATEEKTAIRGFKDLSYPLWSTLKSSASEVITQLRKEDSPIPARLDCLCAIFLDTFEEPRYKSTEKLVISGLGTAVNETVSALRAISRLVRNEDSYATSGEIATIARSSKILPFRMAGVNIAHLNIPGSLVETAGERYPIAQNDIQALQLKIRLDGSRYVDFVQPLVETQSPDNPFNKLMNKKTWYKTLGCPARIKLNGSSPIEKLWDWTIDIAEAENLFVGDNVFLLSD